MRKISGNVFSVDAIDGGGGGAASGEWWWWWPSSLVVAVVVAAGGGGVVAGAAEVLPVIALGDWEWQFLMYVDSGWFQDIGS